MENKENTNNMEFETDILANTFSLVFAVLLWILKRISEVITVIATLPIFIIFSIMTTIFGVDITHFAKKISDRLTSLDND